MKTTPLFIRIRSLAHGAVFLTSAAACATDATEPSAASDQIVFYSERSGGGDIYVVQADGFGLTNLTAGALVELSSSGDRPAQDRDPSWSPDGRWIVFTSNRAGFGMTHDIYVMRADGSDLRRLTETSFDHTMPRWSPDGRRIAFVTNRDGHCMGGCYEVYVMDADGSNPVNLTNHPYDDGMPAWSPDGRRIAFATRRDGSTRLYVMASDGQSPRAVTSDSTPVAWPTWSPDGTRIVFSRNAATLPELATVHPDGGPTLPFEYARISSGRQVSWSPDGSRFVYQYANDIFVIDRVHAPPRRLTDDFVNDLNPEWRPSVR